MEPNKMKGNAGNALLIENNEFYQERMMTFLQEINYIVDLVVRDKSPVKKALDGADVGLSKPCRLSDLRMAIDKFFKLHRYDRKYNYTKISLEKKWQACGERLELLKEALNIICEYRKNCQLSENQNL